MSHIILEWLEKAVAAAFTPCTLKIYCKCKTTHSEAVVAGPLLAVLRAPLQEGVVHAFHVQLIPKALAP